MTYQFEAYDVIQILRDGKWLDFSTLRSESEGRQAVGLVDSGRWEGESQTFRIIGHVQCKQVVKYSVEEVETSEPEVLEVMALEENGEEEAALRAEGYHRCPDGIWRRTPSNGMFDGLCSVCERFADTDCLV